MAVEFKNPGEAMELFTVSNEGIRGFNFYLDRDIRRRRLIANIMVYLEGEETVYTTESWVLRKIPQGLVVANDLSRISLYEDHAKVMMEELHKVGVRTEGNDERSKRIKELKERIRFLEAIVLKSVGITRDDLRLIRDE
jgi:hypothetical protein